MLNANSWRLYGRLMLRRYCSSYSQGAELLEPLPKENENELAFELTFDGVEGTGRGGGGWG